MIALELLIIVGLLAVLLQPIVPLTPKTPTKQAFPTATVGIIALQVLVYFLAPNIEVFGLVPESPSFWSVLTYAFLHLSPAHLMGNIVALWLIGTSVEEALGAARYLLLYLVGAAFAGLAHVLVARISGVGIELPLIGASGAIFTLLGLFVVRFWRTKVRLFWVVPVPAAIAGALVLLLQLALALRAVRDGGDGVSYIAHLAGMALGFGLAFPLRMLEDSEHAYGIEDAEAAMAAGDYALASECYRRVLARQPENARLHHALGVVSVRLNQDEAASRYFTASIERSLRLGDAPAVAKALSDARTLLPNFSLPARLLPGVAAQCEEVRQYGLAQFAYTTLLRDFPAAPDAELVHLRLAKLHLQRLNQPGNAIAILTEFLRTYPQSEWRQHAQALLEEAEKRVEDAH